jgi:hypothetical protein
MTDNLATTIRQWNNTGVTHLAEGHLTDALAVLHQAMQQLRVLYSVQQQQEDEVQVRPDRNGNHHNIVVVNNVENRLIRPQPPPNDDEKEDDPPVPVESERRRQLLPPPSLIVDTRFIHPSLHSNNVSTSPNNVFQPFTKAFVLNVPPEGQPQQEADLATAPIILGEDSILDMTMVVLHNFGVALQQKGLLHGEQSVLETAQKIFLMEKELVLEHWERPPPPLPQNQRLRRRQRRPSCPVVIILALWNNLGHLYSHFHDLPHVQECQQQLRYHLRTITTSSQEEEETDHVETDDLRFFHQTILFWETCNLNARAAAA